MKLPPMIPHRSGQVADQAHVGLPEGTYEEEHGRNGFFGKVSHLYRSKPPTAWSRIEGPLQPQAFDLNKLTSGTSEKPIPVLGNSDVRLWMYTPRSAPNAFWRNADADDVWFIHKGKGKLETDYGPLHYRKGDYLVLPRGTTYRFLPELTEQSRDQFYLRIESFSEMEIPDRGQLGRNAFYDPAVIEIPQAQESTSPATADGEWEVQIKREDEYTSVFYPSNPLNVRGWRGDLFPWRLNVEDIRPITSHRFHLPPSVHTTLKGNGFILCTFAPRPLETGDPKAMRVPFFHSNIDYDEVIFYHDGDFFSRAGIGPGMLTFHPQGIHHGPQPKALANQHKKDFTDEYAVMIDTVRPLKILPQTKAGEMAGYKDSWKEYLSL